MLQDYYEDLCLQGKHYIETHPNAPDAFHEKYAAHRLLVALLAEEETCWYEEGERLLEETASGFARQVYIEFLRNLRNHAMVSEPGDRRRRWFITRQNRRARKNGMPASLTFWQWEETLHYFKGRCAYCQKRLWTRMEHFVPLIKGGGTTWDNCVPSCNECDKLKGENTPEYTLIMERKEIMRVQAYLRTRSKSDDRKLS